MLKYVVLLVAVTTALGAECPVFDTVANLQLQLQLGNWGIHGRVRQAGVPDPKLQCLHMEFTADQVDIEPVIIKAHVQGTYIDTGVTFTEDHQAQVNNLLRPGRWEVVENGTTYRFSVIHSDYVEYSLMAKCSDVGGVVDIDILFAGRSHNPISETVIENYKTLLKEYGVDVTNYQSVLHGHMICH